LYCLHLLKPFFSFLLGCTSYKNINNLVCVVLVHHLSSLLLVHPHLPLSKSQTALSIMHHPVFGIISITHSFNLIHHLSPTSHHPSLSRSSIPDSKLACSTLPTIDHLLPSRTSYHSALCFSSSVSSFS